MDKEELEFLTEKVKVLKKYLESGKLRPNPKLIDSLQRVQFNSDNVDPNTVDGVVKATANAIYYLHSREEYRKIPLIKVQEKYYEIIETFFKSPYNEMKKNNVTPHQIAISMSRQDSIVKATAKAAPNIFQGVIEFWKTMEPVVSAHLENLPHLKTLYGGDIFPSYAHNSVVTAGLYSDTVVLPDPIHRISMLSTIPAEKLTYYLAKHCLRALDFKDLALANLPVPIVVVAPDPFILDDSAQKIITKLGTMDAKSHLEKLFGKNFSSEQEMEEFLSQIKTPENLQAEIKDSSRLLFDTDWKGLPLEEQLKKADTDNPFAQLRKLNLGKRVEVSIQGRMMQINEVLYKADKYSALPFMDAPTSFKYLTWKYEYGLENAKKDSIVNKDSLIINSLQKSELVWLGKLPNEVLIELRKEGALQELREMLSKGVRDVETASEGDFDMVVEDVTNTLSEGWLKHRQELEKVKSGEIKFYGRNVAPFMINGVITFAAGYIRPEYVGSAINLIQLAAGGKSLVDIYKNFQKLRKEKSNLNKKAMGILFNSIEK